MNKQDAVEQVREAKARTGATWAQLAEVVNAPVAWTTAALLGQHPMSEEQAKAACQLLGLSEDAELALQRQPYRGSLGAPIPTDPTMYRIYEALQVYGPTIKELIHEEFGDGIMSAINFKVDVARREDPRGDRVVITLDGKFLAYEW